MRGLLTTVLQTAITDLSGFRTALSSALGPGIMAAITSMVTLIIISTFGRAIGGGCLHAAKLLPQPAPLSVGRRCMIREDMKVPVAKFVTATLAGIA